MLALRIGMLALCLMASAPYLMPVHTAPIPSFHAEWLAAALGLAGAVALLGAQRLPLPGASLLAMALAAIAGLQTMLGRAPIPQLTGMFGLYLLWAALLAAAASHIAQTAGRARFARTLAAAILLGSVFAALTAIFQPFLKQAFGWTGFGPAMGGALGQRNHFADYLWLGLASALYLRTIGILPRAAFWSTAFVLTLAAALGGQRSSLLYAAALVAVSFWRARSAEGAADAMARRLSIGIALLFLLMQPVAMVFPEWTAYEESAPPPAMRTVSELSARSIRLQLASLGAKGIAAAPLLGNGIGSFPSLAIAFADDISPADNPGPAEHGHNLALDLSVEAGLPAALLALAAAIAWVRRLRNHADAPEAAWAIAVFAVLTLHSMIEYPLWHTYFLGLLAVVAGAFGNPRAVGHRLTPTALTLGLIAWGSIALADLKHDYALLETALALGKESSAMPTARAALLRIPRRSLLSPWVNTAACVSLDPLLVPLTDGMAVCQIAMDFAPTVASGENAAILWWRQGAPDVGRLIVRRLQRVWPSQSKALDARWAALSGNESETRRRAESPPSIR